MREVRIRLNRLEGHIRAIGRMLEEGRDCRSLLTQVSAAKAALNRVAVRLLEGYIEGCLEGGPDGQMEMQKPLKEALARALRFS